MKTLQASVLNRASIPQSNTLSTLDNHPQNSGSAAILDQQSSKDYLEFYQEFSALNQTLFLVKKLPANQQSNFQTRIRSECGFSVTNSQEAKQLWNFCETKFQEGVSLKTITGLIQKLNQSILSTKARVEIPTTQSAQSKAAIQAAELSINKDIRKLSQHSLFQALQLVQQTSEVTPREAIEQRRLYFENEFGLYRRNNHAAPRLKGASERDKLFEQKQYTLNKELTNALYLGLIENTRKEPLYPEFKKLGANDDNIWKAFSALRFSDENVLGEDPAFATSSFEKYQTQLKEALPKLKQELRLEDPLNMNLDFETQLTKTILLFEIHAHQVDYLDAGQTKELKEAAKLILEARTQWLEEHLAPALAGKDVRMPNGMTISSDVYKWDAEMYVQDLTCASEFFALRELIVLDPGLAKDIGTRFFNAIQKTQSSLLKD